MATPQRIRLMVLHWCPPRRLAVVLICLFGLLGASFYRQKTPEELEREQFAKECASKKGCPYRDPKSHADWVLFADKETNPLGKVPNLDPNGPRRIFLFGIIAADTNIILVEHFIEHYIRIGLKPEHFFIVLSDEDNNLKGNINADILQYLERSGFLGYYIWNGVWSNSNMAIVREKILKEIKRSKTMRDIDWLLEPDADELQMFPDVNLPHFLDQCDKKGINILYGVWRDRVSIDGRLNEVVGPSVATLAQQLPLMCALRTVGKIMVRRAYISVSDGKHKVVGNTPIVYLQEVLPVMHFKWVNGALERLEHKIKMANNQGRLDHRSVDIINHIKDHDGALDVKSFLNTSVCCQPKVGSGAAGAEIPCDPTTVLIPHKAWGFHDAVAPWEEDTKVRSIKLNSSILTRVST